MPVNVSPQYAKAEKEYLQAQSLEEKIERLKDLIREVPKHKGGENLRAQLRTRLKKFREQQEKSKKSGKSSKPGIKKEDMQAVIVGETNSGKSSLLSLLTNAKPKISETKFTTTEPIVGMMDIKSVNIQLIEIPAIESENYDKGIIHTADTVLVIITNLNNLLEIEKKLKTTGKKIIVFNKSDLLSDSEKRKISATLQSKKYNFSLISAKTKEGIRELKNKIFQSFDKIRVYTKEPGKEKAEKPIILNPGATVKEVAEKIFKGFSNQVKESRVTGPSSKFPSQRVSLKHKLKDLDVIEFKI